jgi:trk system potassium uptake protein TrkA
MAYAIIVGGGKIGYYLAKSLINRDFEVLLLEKDSSKYFALAADLGDVAMFGDGCEPLVLKTAGVERADLLIAVTGDDPDNLIISQLAAHCFKRTRIIARVNNPDNDKLFETLGIKERISGTAAILDLLGQKVGRTPVVMLGALEHCNIEAMEIILDENSPWVGARLEEANLPAGVNIISVVRNGGATLPNSNTVFQAGDVLVALIPKELEATLREFIV